MMLTDCREMCPDCLGAKRGCYACAFTGSREAYERFLAMDMQLESDEIATQAAIDALDKAIELAYAIGAAGLPVIRKCEEALRALGIETDVILEPSVLDKVQRWAQERMHARD